MLAVAAFAVPGVSIGTGVAQAMYELRPTMKGEETDDETKSQNREKVRHRFDVQGLIRLRPPRNP